MRRLSICLLLLLMVGVSAQSVAQGTITGKIVLVGVPDRYKAANANQPTAGLKTVAIGSRIVMKAVADSGDGKKQSDRFLAVTSAAWTVTGPVGSAVTAVTDTGAGLSGKIVYFVPDIVGTYTVTMIATTPKGNTPQVTISVTGSKWAGTGISTPYTANGVANGCFCHTSSSMPQFTEWAKTKHATALKRRFDGLTDQGTPEVGGGHFADYCMPCHSAGYYGTKIAGGYAEYAAALKFKVVSPQHVGVYDSLVAAANPTPATPYSDSLKTMLSLMGIQCENCHGPAGEHKKTGDKTKISKSWDADVCAPCHFSSDRHPKGYSWAASAHAISMTEGADLPYYTNRAGCSQCHTAEGFVDQWIGKRTEPVPPAGQTKIYLDGHSITCVACHDPHSEKNPAQLRVTSIGDACMGCHKTRFSGQSGLHHAHQGQLLIGVNGVPMSASIPATGYGEWGGWELPGYTYSNSTGHANIAERCVECHMAATPTFDPTFVKADTLLNKIGGHTFKIMYDNNTPLDAADDVLNDVGCRECHGPVAKEFVELSQAKIKTLLAQLYAIMPLRDTTKTVDNPRGTPAFPQDSVAFIRLSASYPGRVKLTTVQKAAAYNYAFVLNDGSFGVHNYNYAAQLLATSIEQLKLGNGAVTTFSVADRKNDNGRYVRVAWNPFPAEKAAYSPVMNYFVMVRVNNVPLNAPAVKVNNFTEMISQAQAGKLMVANGVGFMPFGPIPALNQILVKDVPTDLDSNAAGRNYTAVYVAGIAADGKVYASPIDSSYSVVNIAPSVTGFGGTLANGGAQLKWAPAQAIEDPANVVTFTYNVYRSTTQNFDVTGQTPIATGLSTAQYLDKSFVEGTKYYYKVVTMVGGVKSAPSTEVSLTVTGVSDEAGMPTEFALKQNYPNPFNPSTEIGFALPQASHVRISIYNVAGVEVKTLVDEVLGAGNKKVTWNGRDNKGQTVASGVYLYRIQAGSFVSTMKMVMMK